ncbi:MAG TPA: nicotinate-nucleotide adenylyltransferase [Burkholderiaceae bacterium]|nr:nicotinate-nucleotide adenylyltransferase [Burkholderiaceae bacterium]
MAKTLPFPIGLLGGTFDPIHRGHLQLARDAQAQLGLAEVRFIPTAAPWQKKRVTPAVHRAQMVELAIAGEPGFVLDMREIERGDASYTIDTLRDLRRTLGADVPLVLIMGGDQMQGFDTWRDWRAIIDFAHLAVARRNDAAPVLNDTLQRFYAEHRAPVAQLRAQPAGRLVEIDMTPIDASATEIRALLGQPAAPARDARLAACVPAAVLDYIEAHRLYK